MPLKIIMVAIHRALSICQQPCQLLCISYLYSSALFCELRVIPDDQTKGPENLNLRVGGRVASPLPQPAHQWKGLDPSQNSGFQGELVGSPSIRPAETYSCHCFPKADLVTQKSSASELPAQLLSNQLILQQKQTDQLENNEIGYMHGHSCRVSLK